MLSGAGAEIEALLRSDLARVPAGRCARRIEGQGAGQALELETSFASVR